MQVAVLTLYLLYFTISAIQASPSSLGPGPSPSLPSSTGAVSAFPFDFCSYYNTYTRFHVQYTVQY